MPEFLELLPPMQARKLLFDHLPPSTPRLESIKTNQAYGRVIYENVQSPENLPAFPRSTVDGFAVQANSTYGASDNLPAYVKIIGECPMGDRPGFTVQANEAAIIHTGGMLPEGSDAVVMLEHSQTLRSGDLEIMRPVAVGENIIKVGEDVIVGQSVIPARQIIRSAEVGGLLSLGLTQINVVSKPLIGIISSGDEVIAPQLTPRPGQIRDINSYTLSTLVENCGGTAVRYGIAPDETKQMFEIINKAFIECDCVVITAGSSASARDHTSEIISQLGKPGVLVHGVNVRPGKPTILGVCEDKPVIGLPGNPVSALVIASLFLTPVIHYLLGLPEVSFHLTQEINAILSVNINSQAGREDWIPVQLSENDGKITAEPIFYKSNLIFSLVRANGLAHIPADANGLGAGDQVRVFPLI
jgi:molybdopterin molybdotransferase